VGELDEFPHALVGQPQALKGLPFGQTASVEENLAAGSLQNVGVHG